MTIENRLSELGFVLPAAPGANGNYQTCIVHVGILRTSGQLSREGDRVIEGVVRSEGDIERARHGAEVCALRCLSVARQALGSLDRINRLLSIRGFVAADPGFRRHSQVLDAASDLFLAVMGDAGEHVRTAVGVSSLPSGGVVEIEAEFSVR